jgi:hypothetical protein
LEEKFSFNLSRSPKKYFGSIAHNEQSSKNYFAVKQRDASSNRRARDARDRDHRKESTWTSSSGVTPTLSAAADKRNADSPQTAGSERNASPR